MSFLKLKLSWQICLICLIFLPNLPNSVKIKNLLNVSKYFRFHFILKCLKSNFRIFKVRFRYLVYKVNFLARLGKFAEFPKFVSKKLDCLQNAIILPIASSLGVLSESRGRYISVTHIVNCRNEGHACEGSFWWCT